MKLLIIGGTGGTGKQLIKQSLDQGHQVTAIVRKPQNMKIKHPNLTIVQGDVLEPASFENVLEGQEAVISALGHKRFFIKTSILSEGTKNIIKAMEKYQVKRLICITSLGINDSRFKLGLYYTLFVIPVILLFYFLDKEKQERIIMKSSLDWTIVRPGQLTNGKKRGKYRHGTGLGSYILTKMISRADVAHFILYELDANGYSKQTPVVIY